MNTNAAGGFPHVILASASPRRLDLLRQAGIEPEVEPSHVVEVIRSTKPDRDLKISRVPVVPKASMGMQMGSTATATAMPKPSRMA